MAKSLLESPWSIAIDPARRDGRIGVRPGRVVERKRRLAAGGIELPAPLLLGARVARLVGSLAIGVGSRARARSE